MTTGSRVIGALGSSSYYYAKNWTGSNGKYSTAKVLLQNPYSVTASIYNGTKGIDPVNGSYIYPTFGHVDEFTSSDENELLSRLATKVRGHSFNMSVAVGEGKQTVKLVVDTIHRIIGAVKALKSGRLDLALRHLGAPPPTRRQLTNYKRHYGNRTLVSKDISGMWLEIQYGWRPLIGDVYEAMTAYAAITNKARKTRVNTSVSRSYQYVKFDDQYYKQWNSEKGSKRIIYIMTEKLTTQRSLGLQDPRSVAWELTPWSFVVDWFIPIGTYFENLAVIPFLTGQFIRSEKWVVTGSAYGKSGSPAFKGASCNYKRTTLNRTISTSVAVPFPSFKPLEDALSVGHLKNATALLHQVFGK